MKGKNMALVALIIIVLLAAWYLLKKEADMKHYLKSCSTDEDCIIVGTINGLDRIPEAADRCGCLCVTSINKKFGELWEQKRQEFETGRECRLICKPCISGYDNGKAYCKDNQCVVDAK